MTLPIINISRPNGCSLFSGAETGFKTYELKPLWTTSCYTATLEEVERDSNTSALMKARFNHLLDGICYDLSPYFEHCLEKSSYSDYIFPEISFTLRPFITSLIASLKRRNIKCTPFLVGSGFNHVFTGSKCKDLDIRFYLESPTFDLAQEAFMEVIIDLLQSTSEYTNRQFPIDKRSIGEAYLSGLLFSTEAKMLFLGIPGLDLTFVYHPPMHSVSTFDGGQLCLEPWNETYLIRISMGETFCPHPEAHKRAKEIFEEALEDIKIGRFPVLHPQKIRNLLFRILSCASKRVEILPKLWEIATMKLYEMKLPQFRNQILKHLHNCYGPTTKIIDILNLLSHIGMQERHSQMLVDCLLEKSKELDLKEVDYFLHLINLHPKSTSHLLNMIRGLCLYKWALEVNSSVEEEQREMKNCVAYPREDKIKAYIFDNQSSKPSFYFSLPHKNGVSHLCIPQGHTPVDLIRDFLASWPEIEQMTASSGGIEQLRNLLNCLGLESVPLKYYGSSPTTISDDRLQFVRVLQAFTKQLCFRQVWEKFHRSFDPTVLLDMLKPSFQGKELLKLQQDHTILYLDCYRINAEGKRDKSLSAFLNFFLKYAKGSTAVTVPSLKRLRLYMTDFLNGTLGPIDPLIKSSLTLLAPIILKIVLSDASLPILKEANLFVDFLSHTNLISKEMAQESLLMILSTFDKLHSSANSKEENRLAKEWSYNFICQALKNRYFINTDLIHMCDRLALSMNPAYLVVAFDFVDSCLNFKDPGDEVVEIQANFIHHLLSASAIFEIPQLDLRCCETFLLIAQSHPKIFLAMKQVGGHDLEAKFIAVISRLAQGVYVQANHKQLYSCIYYLTNMVHPSNLVSLQKVFDLLLPSNSHILLNNPALEFPYISAVASIALLKKTKIFCKYQKKALLDVALLLLVSHKKFSSEKITNRELGKKLLNELRATYPLSEWQEILKIALIDKMVIALSNQNRIRGSELFRIRVKDFCEQLKSFISSDTIRELQEIAAKNLITQHDLVLSQFQSWATHLHKHIVKTKRFLDLKIDSIATEDKEKSLVKYYEDLKTTLESAIVDPSVIANKVVELFHHLNTFIKNLDPLDLQPIKKEITKLVILLSAQASQKSLKQAKQICKILQTLNLWTPSELIDAYGSIMNGYQVLVEHLLEKNRPKECRIALHHTLTILTEQKDYLRKPVIIMPLMTILRKFIKECLEEELCIAETILKLISKGLDPSMNDMLMDLCFDFFDRCQAIDKRNGDHFYVKNIKFLEGLLIEKKEFNPKYHLRLDAFCANFMLLIKEFNEYELFISFIIRIIPTVPHLAFKEDTIVNFTTFFLMASDVPLDPLWVILQKSFGMHLRGPSLDLKCIQLLATISQSFSLPMPISLVNASIRNIKESIQTLILRKWDSITRELSPSEKIPFNACLVDIASQTSCFEKFVKFIMIATKENFSFKEKFQLLKTFPLPVLSNSEVAKDKFLELFDCMLTSKLDVKDDDLIQAFQYVLTFINCKSMKNKNLRTLSHTLFLNICNRYPESLANEFKEFLLEIIRAHSACSDGAKLLELYQIASGLKIKYVSSLDDIYYRLNQDIITRLSSELEYISFFDTERVPKEMKNESADPLIEQSLDPITLEQSNITITQIFHQIYHMLPIMKQFGRIEEIRRIIIATFLAACNHTSCSFGKVPYELMQLVTKFNIFTFEKERNRDLLEKEIVCEISAISLLARSNNIELINLAIDSAIEFVTRLNKISEKNQYITQVKYLYQSVEATCIVILLKERNPTLYLKLIHKFQSIWVKNAELLLEVIDNSNSNVYFFLTWLKILHTIKQKVKYETRWKKFRDTYISDYTSFEKFILKIDPLNLGANPCLFQMDYKWKVMQDILSQMSLDAINTYPHFEFIFEECINLLNLNNKYIQLMHKSHRSQINEVGIEIHNNSVIYLTNCLDFANKDKRKELTTKLESLSIKR